MGEWTSTSSGPSSTNWSNGSSRGIQPASTRAVERPPRGQPPTPRQARGGNGASSVEDVVDAPKQVENLVSLKVTGAALETPEMEQACGRDESDVVSDHAMLNRPEPSKEIMRVLGDPYLVMLMVTGAALEPPEMEQGVWPDKCVVSIMRC